MPGPLADGVICRSQMIAWLLGWVVRTLGGLACLATTTDNDPADWASLVGSGGVMSVGRSRSFPDRKILR